MVLLFLINWLQIRNKKLQNRFFLNALPLFLYCFNKCIISLENYLPSRILIKHSKFVVLLSPYTYTIGMLWIFSFLFPWERKYDPVKAIGILHSKSTRSKIVDQLPSAFVRYIFILSGFQDNNETLKNLRFKFSTGRSTYWALDLSGSLGIVPL